MSASPAAELQPIKASLVADLVHLVNLDLGKVVKVVAVGCKLCSGEGIVGTREDQTEATCPECGGVGAVEDFVLDMSALQAPTYGRLIEQWEFKQGRLIPKFRGKTQAFAQLTKILGFDKAVLEVTGAVAFAESLPEDQKAMLVEQLKDLAARGMLDG